MKAAKMTRIGLAVVAVLGLCGYAWAFSASSPGPECMISDDFESYSVGSYPSAKWSMLYSGNYAEISDEQAYSGTKSFKLVGNSGWSRADAISVSFPENFTYSFAFMIAPGSSGGSVGIAKSWGGASPANGVNFNPDDNFFTWEGPEIYPYLLEECLRGKWYKVSVTIKDFSGESPSADVTIAYDGNSVTHTDIPAYTRDLADRNLLQLHTFSRAATQIYFDDICISEIHEPNGPVAHWKFDEGSGAVAYDSAGNNDGTIHGAAWTTGQLGGALDFDGSDDYVSIPHDPTLNITGDITIAAWVNFTRISEYEGIVTKSVGGGDKNIPFEFRTRPNIGPLTFLRADASGHERVYSNYVAELGEWHHVLVRVENKVPDFYVDGIITGKGADVVFTKTPTGNTNPVLIGCRDDGLYFDGTIDDVRIYGRALSAAEIEELYAPYDPGPVAHWKFDEGSGSIAYDSAGTNDGTIYGAQWTDGVLESALSFDGVDDYVEVIDDATLDIGTVCVNAWIKISSSALGVIVNKRDEKISVDYQGYVLFVEDGHVRFGVDDGPNGSYTPNSGTQVNDGKWYFICGQYDGSTVMTLVDGIENTESDASGITGNLTNDDELRIGIQWDGVSQYVNSFDGIIDDVRVYGRVLSVGEIEELYNSVGPIGVTYHVDVVNGDDLNDGLTKETAFATIQMGIDTAQDYDTVLVWPSVYRENIILLDVGITVQSADQAAVIDGDGGVGIAFYTGGGPDSTLKNFVIKNCYLGVYCLGGSPTISNITIVDNLLGISAYAGAQPDISNCIFWNNTDGDLFGDPDPIEARYSFFQDANEPIAYWKLDEGSGTTAYDSAGVNNGTLYGSPKWVSGISGTALDFDGVGERDYVLIAGQTGLLGGGRFDELTVEAWIKTSTINNSGPYAAIVADETTDGEFALAVNEFGSAYGVIYMEGSTGGQLLYGPDATDGEWHHLCLRKDSSEVALFVDVNKYDTVASTGPLKVNQQTHVTLGCKYTTYLSVQFIGVIDEVRIYDRALSVDKIGQLYQPVGVSAMFVDAAGGDYHLRSERGRYWPEHDVWVLDKVSSPCIDGGDPNVDPSNEPMPNGGRINMGAYGNTAYASMSEWPLKHDSNFDGTVNMLDLAKLALEWLQGDDAPPSPPPPPPPT